MYVCLSVSLSVGMCTYIWMMAKDIEKASDSLELELVVGNCQIWVLGTKLWSLEKRGMQLNFTHGQAITTFMLTIHGTALNFSTFLPLRFWKKDMRLSPRIFFFKEVLWWTVQQEKESSNVKVIQGGKLLEWGFQIQNGKCNISWHLCCLEKYSIL